MKYVHFQGMMAKEWNWQVGKLLYLPYDKPGSAADYIFVNYICQRTV